MRGRGSALEDAIVGRQGSAMVESPSATVSRSTGAVGRGMMCTVVGGRLGLK